MLDEHRGAVEYDWRHTFHTGIESVPAQMGWGEAYRLMAILVADPASQICAAVRGWTHPVSREDMVLRDLFDLQHMSKAKRKPDPYVRPWHPKPKLYGTGISVTAAEFAAMKAKIADRDDS